jgi:hypothetical protein
MYKEKAMIRTQVYLTKKEKELLAHLSREMGLHQSALIREAIDQFIANKASDKKSQQEALKAARGLWADRDDLFDITQLRAEFDR